MKKSDIQNRLRSLSQTIHSFQKERDQKEKTSMELFQFPGCPYCSEVRMFCSRNRISFKKRDVILEPQAKKELLIQTGKTEVPCLKVHEMNGESQWLFGSEKIIYYLKNKINLRSFDRLSG